MDLPDYPLFYLKKIQLGGESQYALFAKRDIPKKTCIGFYAGAKYIHKTLAKHKNFDHVETEYGIDVAPRHRIVPFQNEDHITNTQRQTFPLTMMNEPREDETANVNLIVQDFLTEEIDFSRENAKFHNIEKDTDNIWNSVWII